MANFSVLALGLIPVLLGCQAGGSVELGPLSNRTAIVGIELTVPLHAAAAGDVRFSFDSDISDLTTRRQHPTLTVYANGDAMFRWIPLAQDVGEHAIVFTVSAGGPESTVDLPVLVTGGATPLVFREPVGDGTTLDLAQSPCADVGLLIDDTTTDSVDFSLSQSTDNATIRPNFSMSGLSATLHFCPSPAQAMAASIFPFIVIATDPEGGRAYKRYTVVLGALHSPVGDGGVCSMVPPVIVDTPHGDTATASSQLQFSATVEATVGIKNATLYWSVDPPNDPMNPDLSAMTAADMLYIGSTSMGDSYSVDIDSPVYNDAPGTMTNFYYLLRVTDRADQVAGCPSNQTNNPAMGVYQFQLTRSPDP